MGKKKMTVVDEPLPFVDSEEGESDIIVPIIKGISQVKYDKGRYVFIRDGFRIIDYRVIDKLYKVITTVELKHQEIAKHLYELVGCLDNKKFNYKGEAKSKAFYDFCEEYFKYKSAYVRKLLRIHKKFGIDKEHCDYNLFNLSQLVEMLVLSAEHVINVKPIWTCREIREYAKSLRDYEEKSDIDSVVIKNNDVCCDSLKEILRDNEMMLAVYLEQIVNKLCADTGYAEATNNYEVASAELFKMYQYIMKDIHIEL